jgi:Sulfotransferase family
MIDAGGRGEMVTGPIFIGGAARSGKTLLRWILSSHRRIAVSRRTDMWPRFYGRFGDLARTENVERCLTAMLDRKQIAALAPDLDRLRRDFQGGAPTYARLFALLHEQYAERVGKVRWGDQTGSIERYADQLMTAYPGARLIQMVRDPRDRYEALLLRGRPPLGAAGRATAEWLGSVGSADRNRLRHPDACTIVRYESLVRAPEETMRRVCAFVGEAFEPTMLQMPEARRYDAERAASNDGTPISTACVGRYRDRLSRRDLAFIQAVAGRQMLALDYRPDPIHPTAGERVRWATVGWAPNIARLGRRGVLDASRRSSRGLLVPEEAVR